jgi:cytochrome c553
MNAQLSARSSTQLTPKWTFQLTARFNSRLSALVAVSAVSFLSLSSAARAEGNASAGQAKAATCAACHGADGNSVNPEWPSLAGQHSQYTVKQLKAFKTGIRKNDLMTPMAMGLSEQDMEDLGAHFASQSARGLEADKSKVELGQRLFRGGNAKTQTPACIACHGPNGRGNPGAMYPSIRGQQATYIAAQLNAYKKGSRNTDATKSMNEIAAKLSDEEIQAVASFAQGLR